MIDFDVAVSHRHKLYIDDPLEEWEYADATGTLRLYGIGYIDELMQLVRWPDRNRNRKNVFKATTAKHDDVSVLRSKKNWSSLSTPCVRMEYRDFPR